MAGDHRFRITRAGVLNVWQYDEQVFDFADGRLLLRGTNGAGKSKTMEMLLPFVIDGDTRRITASGRHQTSLLWLLMDGYDGQSRTGYVWVEFSRTAVDGRPETLTCGVGMRATAAARNATSWFFTSPRRVGEELLLEDGSGPLSQAALAHDLEEVDAGHGHLFDNARRYRSHVGEVLFGLAPDQYDSLLRLLYWLRMPQVGEDIDPQRLADQLVNALPTVDSATVESAGGTFDELQAFGEDVDRKERAAVALRGFVETYAGYARATLARRGELALEAAAAVTSARRRLRGTERELESTLGDLARAEQAIHGAEASERGATARIAALESSPEARSRARLGELSKRAGDLARRVEQAGRDVVGAQRAAQASADLADKGTSAVHRRTQELHRATVEAAAQVAGCGAHVDPAPTSAVLQAQPGWASPTDLDEEADRLGEIGVTHTGWVGSARAQVGQVRAAVQVVEEARRVAVAAQDEARRAEEESARVETRRDRAARQVVAARQSARTAETAFMAGLSTWRADGDAVPIALPELTREGLDALETLVAEAVEPVRAELAATRADARHRADAALARLAALRDQRVTVVEAVDPAPTPPSWRREDRDGLVGAPLWRLVDFRDTLAVDDRAGLEAALEGAGLLDAWVFPDGRVSDRSRHDVGLVPSAVASGTSDAGPADLPDLTAVLVTDPAGSHLVPTVVVERVLRSIRLTDPSDSSGEDSNDATGDTQGDGDGGLAVAVSGRWASGPARGRTTKTVAQFIGASARAAERSRRLAELDGLIADQESVAQSAGAAAREADTALNRLRHWAAARPRHRDLVAAWTLLEARLEADRAVAAELREAQESARAARDLAATRHAELLTLGERHALPVTADALAAARERARSAGTALDGVERAAHDLDTQVGLWRERAERARADADHLDEREALFETAERERQPVQAEYDELSAAAGAQIEELERRLRELRQEVEDARGRRAAHTAEREGALTRQGGLVARLDTERGALAAAEPARERAFDALRTLYALPGLVAAADIGADPDAPPADREQVRALVDGSRSHHRTDNDVIAAMTALQSSAASVHEPRAFLEDGVYVAVGRDDSGDRPLALLSSRLADRVAADRELLSERERELFENHVLGQLGDALRDVRRQAEELVVAMNDQLAEVSTSQGIRVRLRWRLRDDIPADARRAVELLGQPLGSLLPGERAELRDALHRLIELSRSEVPEDSYAEHLGRALDYRQWFAFTVQYHRPEVAQWRDLHRKSALSQGEQKVLCYLPLFAAAAAHFTSLAGAAPHAPRFVLLDDAFPKIDARTHPLLFGLLVDLDLDFIITSERLWGTHASVPSLAIYEALRNPAQRGIAQFEHRWDGQQLTAVGVT